MLSFCWACPLTQKRYKLTLLEASSVLVWINSRQVVHILMAFLNAQAQKLNKDIFETIYYHALKTSAELAVKEGPYETYTGSPVSKVKSRKHALKFLWWSGKTFPQALLCDRDYFNLICGKLNLPTDGTGLLCERLLLIMVFGTHFLWLLCQLHLQARFLGIMNALSLILLTCTADEC